MRSETASGSYRERLSDENALLLAILEGTARETGEEFFRVLVKELARALDTCGALVADYLPETGTLLPRAYWLGDDWVDPGPYEIAGTPCEGVIRSGELFQIPDRVIDHYPRNTFLRDNELVSYTGMPFKDTEGRIIGHLAVLDGKPVPDEARYLALFRIFGDRAAAEMRRLRAERELREREEQLSRLIDGALDAIVEFDGTLRVLLANPSAREIFAGERDAALPDSLQQWFCADSVAELRRTVAHTADSGGARQAWFGRRLRGRRADGTAFELEATLSRAGSGSHTLILRDVQALHEAENRVRELERETGLLRDELNALARRPDIIGRSERFRAALAKAHQVAATDATVLLLGETGSGKEVFARAIHDASARAARPLVTVNCAAIPRELVESEFFGHARGAFTGATAAREGRFARADGGTIFLDEIGELPLEVQAKLLRVLQDGEVEPVGGSRSLRVDARVIAATNRPLYEEVRAGRFREDLYYRLNVFPIRIPPLRERGDDIEPLAQAFAERAAARLGRPAKPIHPASLERLRHHDWPGNVRELHNIIEHAVIVSRDEWLRPETGTETAHAASPVTAAGPVREVLTVEALRRIERDNIHIALAASGGRVSGAHGAAARLGMNASTLRSRMKALGITRG